MELDCLQGFKGCRIWERNEGSCLVYKWVMRYHLHLHSAHNTCNDLCARACQHGGTCIGKKGLSLPCLVRWHNYNSLSLPLPLSLSLSLSLSLYIYHFSRLGFFKGWDECTSILYRSIWNVKRSILNCQGHPHSNLIRSHMNWVTEIVVMEPVRHEELI
jgi:hypothetical protein